LTVIIAVWQLIKTMAKILNPKAVRNQIESLGLELFTEYTKATEPLSMRCSEGHDFVRNWMNLKAQFKNKTKTICPHCTKWKTKDTAYVKEYMAKFGYELHSEYKDAFSQMDYTCNHGHRNSMSWTNFQRGKRCPECHGRVTNIENLRKEFAKEGFEMIGNYVVGEKIKFICPEGHSHAITIGSWRNGTRCGKCRPTVSQKDVKDSFEKAGYKLENCYVNSKSFLKYVCPNGHKGKVGWHTWCRGTRCKLCQQVVEPEKVKDAFEREGYTLLSPYVSSKKQIEYICPKGHRHSTTAYCFIAMGVRCAVCAGQVVLDSEVVATFKSNGLKTLSPYVNELTPIDCECSKGHRSSMLLKSARKGRPCRVCVPFSSGFQNEKPGILYYLRFEIKGKRFYKIGITNQSIEQRYRQEPLPYTIVMETYYLFGKMARDEETRLLNLYAEHKYKGASLLVSGNTEMFTKDVLNLDRSGGK